MRNTPHCYRRRGWLNKNYPIDLRRKPNVFTTASNALSKDLLVVQLCVWGWITISIKRKSPPSPEHTCTHTHTGEWRVTGWLTPLTVWKSDCDAAAWTRSFRGYAFIAETVVQGDDTWWMGAAEHQQKGSPLSADTDAEARWGTLQCFVWIKPGGNV